MSAHQTISGAFAILGLPNDANSEQVKQAFHDLAQVWHPDRFTHNPRLSAQAEAKMKEFNHAYALLRDYLEGNRQQHASNTQAPDFWESTKKGTRTPLKTLTFGRAPKKGTRTPIIRILQNRLEPKQIAMRMRASRRSNALAAVKKGECNFRLRGWNFLLPLHAANAERNSSPSRCPRLSRKSPQRLGVAHPRVKQVNCDSGGKILF